jgi:hypothetical protein
LDNEWPDEKEPELRARLEKGWEWLKDPKHDDDPERDKIERHWFSLLDQYTAAYGKIGGSGGEHTGK